MDITRFNKVMQMETQHCLDVLETKGREYALGTDRLEHFKLAAEEQGCTPKQALWGMASKHFTSLNAMCKNGSGDLPLWNEKITDSINYLLLLWALVEESPWKTICADGCLKNYAEPICDNCEFKEGKK